MENKSPIYEALAKAKKAFAKVKKESSNPFFNKKYADLETIKTAVDEALASNGLTIVSRVENACVVTALIHIESNDSIESAFPLNPNLDAQKKGSEITYGRRYNIQCLLDLVAEDDDGNQASGSGTGKDEIKNEKKFDALKETQEFQGWLSKCTDSKKLEYGVSKFLALEPQFKSTKTDDLFQESKTLIEAKRKELNK